MNFYKLLFIPLFLLYFSSYTYAQPCIGGGECTGGDGNTNTPGDGDIPEPCDPSIPEGWEGSCSDTNTNTPGNVPIDDYLPILVVLGMTLGGAVVYKNRKRLS